MAGVLMKLKAPVGSVTVEEDGSVLAVMPSSGVHQHLPSGREREWQTRPGTELRNVVLHKFGSVTAPSQYVGLVAPATLLTWGAGFDRVLQQAPTSQGTDEIAHLVAPKSNKQCGFLKSQVVVCVGANNDLALYNPYLNKISDRFPTSSDSPAAWVAAGEENTQGGDLFFPLLLLNSRGTLQIFRVLPRSSSFTSFSESPLVANPKHRLLSIDYDATTDTLLGLWGDGKVAKCAAHSTAAPTTTPMPLKWASAGSAGFKAPSDIAKDTSSLFDASYAIRFASSGSAVAGHLGTSGKVEFTIINVEHATQEETIAASFESEDKAGSRLLFAVRGSLLVLVCGTSVTSQHLPHGKRTLAGALLAAQQEAKRPRMDTKCCVFQADDLLEEKKILEAWRQQAKEAKSTTVLSCLDDEEDLTAKVLKLREPISSADLRGALVKCLEKRWWSGLEAMLAAARTRTPPYVILHSLCPEVVETLIEHSKKDLLRDAVQTVKCIPPAVLTSVISFLLAPLTKGKGAGQDSLREAYYCLDAVVKTRVPDRLGLSVGLADLPQAELEHLFSYFHNRLVLHFAPVAPTSIPSAEQVAEWTAAFLDGCVDEVLPRPGFQEKLVSMLEVCRFASFISKSAASLPGLISACIGTPANRHRGPRLLESKEYSYPPLTFRKRRQATAKIMHF